MPILEFEIENGYATVDTVEICTISYDHSKKTLTINGDCLKFNSSPNVMYDKIIELMNS